LSPASSFVHTRRECGVTSTYLPKKAIGSGAAGWLKLRRDNQVESEHRKRGASRWLADAFKKAGKRLDMGKCCLHFKTVDDLELTSVAKVIAMSTPKEYIAYYKRVKGLA
jgi:hypothetical protein